MFKDDLIDFTRIGVKAVKFKALIFSELFKVSKDLTRVNT